MCIDRIGRSPCTGTGYILNPNGTVADNESAINLANLDGSGEIDR